MRALSSHPYASQGAEISEQAAVVNEYPGDKTTNYGDTKVIVPAGAQTVTVTIGVGSIIEKFDLKAGETVEKDMIAGTGHVLMNAFYVDGMKVDSGNLSEKIFKAAKKIDGSRDQVGYNFGPDAKYDLPAGDYIALIELDGVKLESPFSVKVGDNLETNIMLNAGILAVKAPLYDGWKILSAKPKIDGSSDQFTYGFGQEWQAALVTGDYVIVTTKPDGTGEKKTPVTIKAGERLELTIE
jgi:Ca-activated chloride channel homolog